ncbi:MAG: hypothetical protein AAB593_01455 [Patescibacteria group bacterium]|mgnify:CR=1 FL=1
MDPDFNKKLQDQKDKILDLATEVILYRAEKRIKEDNSLDLKQVLDEEIVKALKEVEDISENIAHKE